MIICCSPTKTMKSVAMVEASQPQYLSSAIELVALMKEKTVDELMTFYKCNEKIAKQNVQRFQCFEARSGYNAGLCYDGLQFKRMCVSEWTFEDWEYAQEHLRIMSGLYGMLRVKDGICAYRLDVENPLLVQGQSLTAYWQCKVGEALADELILDCCSKEYSALLPEHKVGVLFYVEKQGKLKVEATAAKIARGSLIHYCVKHKVNELESVKAFNEGGFEYRHDLSSTHQIVFVKGESE